MIDLEESPFFHSNVVECANEEIYIDMPVEVVFDDVSDEVTLPRFRPRPRPYTARHTEPPAP